MSKLQERAKDRKAWHVAVHGITESDMTEPLISNNKCVFTNLYKAQWITSSQDKTTGIELSD